MPAVLPEISRGTAFPLGVSCDADSVNFSVVSTHASSVSLLLFREKAQNPTWEIELDPVNNRTGHIWHIRLHALPPDTRYAYQVTIGSQLPSQKGVIEKALLLDPYARAVDTPVEWFSGATAPTHQTYRPLGMIPPPLPKDSIDEAPSASPRREELIIYEMHVRGFTQHPSSGAAHPGTFLGVIEKIPHLTELGVNAIELLPVFEWDESEYNCCALSAGKHLCNYWGYSTNAFFAPMNRYAANNASGAAIREFKTMVTALHKAGIEVILDVVYNHTGEGGYFGPTYSFKGFDNGIYYHLDAEGNYRDYTGCGNSVNANHPQTLELILASLRYWAGEMGVDGFRFDLASELVRNPAGHPLEFGPLIDAITNDPLLAKCRLIAEPWDVAGLYQVGSFYKAGTRWSEWNGQYRDSIRRFIKNTPDSAGAFAQRICGSQDLYGTDGSPLNSINFIIAHDGFTLADLVSYNHKHNFANGENNRDGLNENESWNCGVEGKTKDPAILSLRARQMRNFHLALMVSRGIPMLHMGDEYGHTKQGNNNSWCQDGDLNWFQWDKLTANHGFYRFYKHLIWFRKHHPLLHAPEFLQGLDITWHGLKPLSADWSPNSSLVAYQLNAPQHLNDLFIAFNVGSESVQLILPDAARGQHWHWVVDTSKGSPEDIFEPDQYPLVKEPVIELQDHSAVLLKAL